MPESVKGVENRRPRRETEVDWPVKCQVCGALRQPEDSILCRVCGEPVLIWGWAP